MRSDTEEVPLAAGVSWFDVNGWRHTVITCFEEAGVPIVVIQRRLRAYHSSQDGGLCTRRAGYGVQMGQLRSRCGRLPRCRFPPAMSAKAQALTYGDSYGPKCLRAYLSVCKVRSRLDFFRAVSLWITSCRRSFCLR